MELLPSDEKVWSAILEYLLKNTITFDPTIASHSNFYRGFQRLFSFGRVWNRNSMTRKSGRSALSINLKGP